MQGEHLTIVARMKDKSSKTARTIEANIGKMASRSTVRVAGLTARFVGLRGAIAGVATLLTARGIANFTSNVSRQTRVLGAWAEKLRVAPERLSEMKFAAEQNGIAFDLLVEGMKTLQERMTDAANGMRSYRDHFDILGVSVTNADGTLKNVAEFMPELSSAWKAAADAGVDLTLATEDLIGGSEHFLDLMLRRGPQAFDRYTKRARELGVTTKEQIEKSREWGRTMNELRTVFASTTRELIGALVPTLKGAAGRLTDFLKNNKDRIGGFFKGLGDTIVSAFEIGRNAVIGFLSLLDKLPGVDILGRSGLKKELSDVEASLRRIRELQSGQPYRDGAPGTLRDLQASQLRAQARGGGALAHFYGVDGRDQARAELDRMRQEELQALLKQQQSLQERRKQIIESLGQSTEDALRAAFAPKAVQEAARKAGAPQAGAQVARSMIAGLVAVASSGYREGPPVAPTPELLNTVPTAQQAGARFRSQVPGQANAERERRQLYLRFLGSRTPTLDIRKEIAKVRAEVAQIDSAEKFLLESPRLLEQLSPQKRAGVFAELIQSSNSATRRELDEISAGFRQQQLEFQSSVASLGPATREQRLRLAEINAELQRIDFRRLEREGVASSKEVADAIAKVNTELDELRERESSGVFLGLRDGARAAFEQLTNLYQIARQGTARVLTSFGNRFGDAFADAALGIEKMRDAFSKFSASVISDIARMSSRLVSSAIFKLIGGALIGGALGGSGAGAGGGNNSLLIDDFGGIGQHATGHVTNGPELAVIGDNPTGVEAVLPLERRGGKLGVRASGGGGGTTINLHMTLQAIDATNAQEFFAKHMPMVAEQLAAEVDRSSALTGAIRNAR